MINKAAVIVAKNTDMFLLMLQVNWNAVFFAMVFED